jgi:arylsulfatase A-like enzyme
MRFDFCQTLNEITTKLARSPDAATFVHSRSLNLHVALVRSGGVPPEESYPGFNTSYAWRVHRMDTCFGTFIDVLKRRGLYDRSLIVLTADHGELLGEDGKWGHSYYMSRQVIQIPLLMHLPSTIRREAVDADAISLSTDITPSIYALLGYQPQSSNDLMGRPLVAPDGIGRVQSLLASRARRRGTYVLAASYGAVYAVVRQNGHRLYIADAINGGDRAFERERDGPWVERDITDGLRTMNQLAIRRYIDELADLYRLE